MNLTRFPRQNFSAGTTPIEKLETLSEKLGGPNIYVKRDDMYGTFSPGGNKTRKLEFLLGEALELGANAIITCGAVQSNHCRLTIAASVKLGLECHLVLEERVPGSYKEDASGNNLHYRLLGAKSIKVVKGGADLLAHMNEISETLKAQGKTSYIIPTGGSNPVGALGYAACALEIMQQLFEMNIKMDYIVLTSGSSGTHAGMLVGMHAINGGIPIVGISISRKADLQKENVNRLCISTANKIGLQSVPKADDIIVYSDYVGGGYSIPTDGMVDAVKLLATTEALILDPVYTGKTMHGLIDLIKKGVFKKGENVLFLHTGGSTALYAYKEQFGL